MEGTRMSGNTVSRLRDNITPKVNMDGLCRFLRSHHPVKTANAVAAKTKRRVPAKTVSKWLHGENGISASHMFQLAAAYGPDALVAVWGGPVPFWLDDAAMADAKARRKAQIAQLNQEIDALEAKRADTKEVRG